MSAKTLMTVEEFAQMHTADTENYELVEGELVPLPSSTPRNCVVRDFIGHLLWTYFRSNRIGRSIVELDCRTSIDKIRRPDLSIFLDERLRQIDMNKTPVPFAPDIAVEVLSPSESAIDVLKKVNEYLGAGSKEVWLLDHVNDELLIYANTGGVQRLRGNAVLESPLLPGFSIPVAEVFAVD